MPDRTPQLFLSDYPARTTEKLRYGDTDRQGHINNAVFATLCETGRVALLFDPARPLTPSGTQFVIVKLVINFLGELYWPGDVVIGTGITRVGRSSIDMIQGIFFKERCVATAESVIVLLDEETRRSTSLPQTILDSLEAWRVAGLGS